MFKFLLAVLALALAAIGGVAYSQSPAQSAPIQAAPQAGSDLELNKLAQPRVIVAPDYPPAAVATKTTGYVDVELLITEYGHVGEVRSLKSTPKNIDFEKAIRDVIDRWFFYAARSECRPAESVGNVRVWFDIRDDKGMVSVSKPKPPAAGTPKSFFTSTNRPAIHAAVIYPHRARLANAQGDVHITMTVDAKTGKVTSIDDVYASSIPTGSERYFAEASKEAALQFKGDPIPGNDKPIMLCMPFTFRLTN